jgi:hypothetical protein
MLSPTGPRSKPRRCSRRAPTYRAPRSSKRSETILRSSRGPATVSTLAIPQFGQNVTSGWLSCPEEAQRLIPEAYVAKSTSVCGARPAMSSATIARSEGPS